MTVSFTQSMFLEYYAKCFEQVLIPAKMENREFGFMLPDNKMMIRHKALENPSQLQTLLQNLIPSDVYHSIAYYDEPDAMEMTEKGWNGADLVFDIDADHIPTLCGKTHDEWICIDCGFLGKGIPPDACPCCGTEKLTTKTWPCEECVESAKQETIKLLGILSDDFGASEDEVEIFFSGHRGYHVYVHDPFVQQLDSVARKEIVDYVTGLGFEVNAPNSSRTETDFPDCLESFHFSAFGWKGRVARNVQSLVRRVSTDYQFGSESIENLPRSLIANGKNIEEKWRAMGYLTPVKGIGTQTWKRLVEQSVRQQSARIDTVVTTDTHRLIRLAGSLHGKTGLKKVEVAMSDIDSFDPFRSAVAFEKGETTVFVESVPEFRIGEGTFGPFDDQKVTLPTAAALLLVCKKRAKVVE